MTSKPIFVPVHIRGHEPTERQKAAGNYKKRLMKVGRLKIRVENEPGSVRRSKPGVEPQWQVRMKFPYGYIVGSRGVDGDEVDCYVGAFLDAPMVYVIHQRRAGRWRQYDEDKCMIGFGSEEDAKAAYLQHYNDRRFLGPVTAMPMAEFERKVMATKDKPAMIKALLVKAHVKQHTRTLSGGKVVVVTAHDDKRRAKGSAGDDSQLALFVPPKKDPPFPPEVAANPEKHTVDMFDGKTAAEKEKQPETVECPSCHYAHLASEKHCPNPACEANPHHNRAGVAAWKEKAEKEKAAQAERDRISEIRRRASEPVKTKKFYVTMVRAAGTPSQKVGWLAGPFDTHEEAKGHVESARAAAAKVDPFSEFDAFGTASRESDKHPPGVLNRHLGLS